MSNLLLWTLNVLSFPLFFQEHFDKQGTLYLLFLVTFRSDQIRKAVPGTWMVGSFGGIESSPDLVDVSRDFSPSPQGSPVELL